MSDNETTKAKGWSDKERFAYVLALIEHSNVKLDYHATPRPAGRSVIACQRMVERLKATVKNELEAIEAGKPIVEQGTPKKAAASPKKRKGKEAAVNGEADGSPTKRGRKKKVAAVDEAEAEEDEI